MMNLEIETKDKAREGDVINAYNEALSTCNLSDFINSLKSNIGNSEIGMGGNHVWIYDKTTNKRIATIINLFN